MTETANQTSPAQVRTRFAPSPSGDLHVGNIRTALYSWAFARHTGGTFVFRVEDTDRSRVTDEAIRGAAETLHWLGLDWDEGIDVGGPYGPYLQSERLDLYHQWVQKFLDEGYAYYCYRTQEELEAERERQKAAGEPLGYRSPDRELTREQIAAYEAEGRKPVVRFRMPQGQTVVHDLIRGDVVFDHDHVPDFVIMRANGYPLYNLAVSVDDALMQLTHIVRGDDLLASTPRQIAVYRAMGVAEDNIPVFAHLPWVLGPDGKPLSKRYNSASISWYRDQGYLPEAVVNYLALLGWSPGGDQEDFSLAEMVDLFTLQRVGAAAARMDEKKLNAINGDKIRALSLDDFVERIVPVLARAGLVHEQPTEQEHALVYGGAPLIQERISTLNQAVEMLDFLLLPEDRFSVDPEAAARILTSDSGATLQAAIEALESVDEWADEPIEQALRAALVDGLGLKPKHAFGPVRVAVSGRRVSPPLFESLTLLGRERALTRMRHALTEHVG